MMIVSLTNCFASEEAAPRFVALREISGDEEVANLSPAALVEHLLIGGSLSSADLSLSDQDLILAEIYRSIYGDRVECRTDCAFCGQSYEMSFALDDWLESLVDGTGPEARVGPEGTFELDPYEDGGPVRFRLPKEIDLSSLAGRDASEIATALRRICVVEGDPADPRLEAAMARVGPLLEDEIETECAYCERAQTVEFCISDYLLAVLARERPLVSREVHYLARTYHWSRSEILAMPRSSRREQVRLVIMEMEAERRPWQEPI